MNLIGQFFLVGSPGRIASRIFILGAKSSICTPIVMSMHYVNTLFL